MSDQNPLAASLQLLWEGLPESERGPKPKLTLDQIIQAGMALADTEGLHALSMRRLAQTLGTGTMTLYRYVPSKAELLNLMLDAVVGPDRQQIRARDAGWRRFLEVTAWGDRELYLEHPWVLQASWTRPVLGPNSMADLELMLAGLAELPLSDQEKMNLVTSLDSFVMGAVRQQHLWQNAAAESEMSDEQFWGHQLPTMESAMASGHYPAMANVAEDAFDSTWEDSFSFGLRLLLDGLEGAVGTREAAVQPPSERKASLFNHQRPAGNQTQFREPQ